MRFNKLFLPIGLLAIGVLWGACVDVPSGPATTTNPDFRSQVRFVHAASGIAANNVTIDGPSVGNIGFLAATPYIDVASGSRALGFATLAQAFQFTSEQQSTILFYNSGATLSVMSLLEGHKDKNNGHAGAAKIRLINVAEGSAANVSVYRNVGGAALGTTGFGATPAYTNITPGTFTMYAQSVGSYSATVSGAQEVPPVTTTSTGTATVTQDSNGAAYSVTVTSDNTQGFYTAAHFHNEAAGANGSVVRNINVTKQRMTLASAALSGANEVPPVLLTSASGTGTFTLWRDSLQYTITVTADTIDTVFTAAHFHNAAAGANGPVVRTIATGPFGSSTFTGTWTATDSEPLTPALVSEIIAGNVYVNFHSTLFPGGVIRAQLQVNATTSNTYSGTWKASDGQPLTGTLQEEFNLNRIYVNFHTAANPGGQVRGQLNQSVKFGASSVTQDYADGKMYTLVASGAGSTFQLTVLPDRQVAAPPTGKPQVTTVKK